MNRRKPILIVQLRQQTRQELQRLTAQVGSVPGVDAVRLYNWRMEARNLAGDETDPGNYFSARRKTEQRRQCGKPQSDTQPGDT
jgi:hypothetical protein